MGIPVQRCRNPLVVEPARNDNDRYACVQHLGRHEVPEVVQSERWQPSRPAIAEERLGHSIRLPRCGAIVVTEDERFSRRAACGRRSSIGEEMAGLIVEIDDVPAFRLGRCENWPVGSFDPTGTE